MTTDFQGEGAFLLSAERAADALERRLRASHPNVRVFPLSRDELQQIADSFARSVQIARVYHLAAALPKDEAA
jgi:hypothetical protein